MVEEWQIEKVKEILEQHGIDMAVGGCGCCDSPWVYFAYKGEVIIDDEGLSGFDMTGEFPSYEESG